MSSSTSLDDDLLSRLGPNGSIYVCTDALPEFAKRVLPRIEHTFTLVSGDSDLPVAAHSIGEEALTSILSHPGCRAWFAQNAAARHDKLFALPIGLDYHTMWERPGMWGLTPVSPLAQEWQLLDTFARSPRLVERYMSAYCNWQHALDRGDRKICLESMDRSICLLEQQHIPRGSCWARQAEFLFVVSPEGVGMDCHRTWEALLLGCIPIVRRNWLSPLLAGLPVLILEDWSELRRARLEAFLGGFATRKFDFSPLFRDTWIRRIHGLAPQPPLEYTAAEFRRLLTRQSG